MNSRSLLAFQSKKNKNIVEQFLKVLILLRTFFIFLNVIK
jgi:hypothetical protein